MRSVTAQVEQLDRDNTEVQVSYPITYDRELAVAPMRAYNSWVTDLGRQISRSPEVGHELSIRSIRRHGSRKSSEAKSWEPLPSCFSASPVTFQSTTAHEADLGGGQQQRPSGSGAYRTQSRPRPGQ
jgi:hypothetical protein